MKTIVDDGMTDTGELELALGKKVILFCMNYFYAGTLTGVGGEFLRLDGGGIVYETGPFDADDWSDFQKIGGVVRVARDKVEAWAVRK